MEYKTEWFDCELLIDYKETPSYQIEEGHGFHRVDTSEKEIQRVQLYVGGTFIDISKFINQIERVL